MYSFSLAVNCLISLRSFAGFEEFWRKPTGSTVAYGDTETRLTRSFISSYDS